MCRGFWFEIFILLSVNVIAQLENKIDYKEIKNPYEGYPLSAVLVIGLGTMAVIFIGALILTLITTDSDREYGID